MAYRISQRQPLACRECTRRKRKCDKRIPCSRCQRLGLDCTREVVHLRRRLNQNGSEIEFLQSMLKDLDASHHADISKCVQKLTDRLEFLISGPSLHGIDSPSTGSAHPSPSAVASEGQNVSVVTAVEHLAWGRSNGNCFPHRRCGCQYQPSWAADASSNSLSFNLAASEQADILNNLPSPEDATKLVSFHMEHIAWHHNCVHSPTFWEQCKTFWLTGLCDDFQWIALYCSILSTTSFCVANSAKFTGKLDLGPNIPTPDTLFTTMVNILYSSNFLKEISFYSVQAIVISTEVAHNLGLSQLNATLLNAAIRIAECLGVHKIEETVLNDSESELWLEQVEKEVGKRVWCQMVIQDHFAIPFTDSYSINPAQYSTGLPSNADDGDLVAMPDSIPTVSTYTRVLVCIAKLMPELADGLGPLSNRNPLQEQYKHVLRMDQKMRQIVNTIPSFLLRLDQEQEAKISWLGIARRSLAITAAEKIIMIHRPFIFQSFQDHAYSLTRRTCVSAALTILREHENIVNSGDICLWTHTAFCITAAVVLCFEINIGQSEIAQDKINIFRDQIRGACNRLAIRNQDILAQRGVLLINAIYDHAEKSPSQLLDSNSEKINFQDLITRFNVDYATHGIYTGIHAFSDLYGDSNDFEAWFNDVFNTLQ